MEILDLQNRFASLIAKSVRCPWDEIRFHYENVDVKGVPREVFTSFSMLDNVKTDLHVPLEALDVLLKLKQQKPESQSEEWTWLEFQIERSGKYRFDYKYDAPPLIMEQLKYSK